MICTCVEITYPLSRQQDWIDNEVSGKNTDLYGSLTNCQDNIIKFKVKNEDGAGSNDTLLTCCGVHSAEPEIKTERQSHPEYKMTYYLQSGSTR